MFLYEFLSNGQKIQQWHWGKENCCGGRKVKAVEIYFLKKKKKKKKVVKRYIESFIGRKNQPILRD